MESFVFAAAIVTFALWFSWVILYGIGRGTLASLLRGIWILPIILAFFPETKFENLPRTLALKPLHILVDDSDSMLSRPEASSQIRGHVNDIKDECLRLGCSVKETKLSELSPLTREGFTPLSKVLESWMYGTSGEPWVLITDGGDYRPSSPWSNKYRNFGRDSLGKNRGLILGVNDQQLGNIWLELANAPTFSFADHPLELSVQLKRTRPELYRETVQIQVLSNNEMLTTVNATFGEEEDSIGISLPMMSLAKGHHLLTIKALPAAEEIALWDNVVHQAVEVLPNTIGVLHLLGSPSWDGRFLRRALKAEPKYDLISFFILRDPTDMHLVNERELSLIPFPVDRLFNEELPNFHLVVLQNFALSQFLESPYQRNLVNFVKNGGGLLFLGGPRALQPGDADNSSLSSILPFKVTGGGRGMARSLLGPLNGVSETGPYYDPNLGFNITLAEPNREQRDLANVFEDYARMLPSFASLGKLEGLHHVENVEFRDNAYTPLLMAERADGKKEPLVVASYPGKGRALWVFSDSFYKMGLSPGVGNSRDLYQDFISSSFDWLLRQELKKPLTVREFKLDNTVAGKLRWDLDYVGAAGKYLAEGGQFQIKICGQIVKPESYHIEQIGYENWEMSGVLTSNLGEGVRCEVEISGVHDAFGSVKANLATVVPYLLKDPEVPGSTQKLQQLAALTGAKLVTKPEKVSEAALGFLDEVTGRFGVSYPSRYRTVQDHFWILNQWWFYVMLLALPLEVITRRWPQLTSARRRTEAQV